jgi:hypothetical protein
VAIDADLVEAIAQASYQNSPPSHPTLTWAELAQKIANAREQLNTLPAMSRPAGPADPLAERASSGQMVALAEVRRRASVLRAEAARLLAAADPDGAAAELVEIVKLAEEVAAWGTPATAELAADLIAQTLDALERPDAAPMTIALAPASKQAIGAVLEGLDSNDPAGRLRALTETTARRVEAMRARARSSDGPTAVRDVASRYVPGASLPTAEDAERAIREAFAFSRALADGWDRPSRSAITERLRQRQAEDATGVLVVLLGDAPQACDDDARLRERIADAIKGLR